MARQTPAVAARLRFQRQCPHREWRAPWAPQLDLANATAAEIIAGLADPQPNPFVVEGPVPIQHLTAFTFNAGSGELEGEEPHPEETFLMLALVPAGLNRDGPPTGDEEDSGVDAANGGGEADVHAAIAGSRTHALFPFYFLMCIFMW